MNFGSVDDISEINFQLPPDHWQTEKVLSHSRSKKTGVYVGCAKWGRPDWRGILFPVETKEKDFLHQYVKQFNSIELNATHHRIPSAETVKKWASIAEPGFLFCPKFAKAISVYKELEGAGELTKLFASRLRLLKKHLGPCFLQLMPTFIPAKAGVLKNYIKLLIDFPAPVFIEFRNEQWFDGSEESEAIFSMMEELKIGTVVSDTAGERKLVHQRLTTPSAFIRFVGHSLHPTDFKRIDEWAERIKTWIDKGLKSCYFFLHNNSDKAEIFTPDLAVYTVKKFNSVLKIKLQVPKLYKNY